MGALARSRWLTGETLVYRTADLGVTGSLANYAELLIGRLQPLSWPPFSLLVAGY